MISCSIDENTISVWLPANSTISAWNRSPTTLTTAGSCEHARLLVERGLQLRELLRIATIGEDGDGGRFDERGARWTSSTVARWYCRKAPARRAVTSIDGEHTHVPPREPRRTSTSDWVSRIRSAARNVGRDTPNRSISSFSDASGSPTGV